MISAFIILLLAMSVAALVGIPLTFVLEDRCSLSGRWIDRLVGGLAIAGVLALAGWTGLALTALVLAG